MKERRPIVIYPEYFDSNLKRSQGRKAPLSQSVKKTTINEILTVLLMPHKFNVPVFPHAGGVGLWEYVQHLCMLDYVLINGEKDSKVVEYQDSLHEHFKFPCVINNSNYMPPNDSGYSIEMKQDSIDTYSYPNGDYWIKNK